MNPLDMPARTLKPLAPFDTITMCAVLDGLQALTGGQIQEIRQPTPTDIALTIRAGGQTSTLRVCTEARLARMHLTSARLPNAGRPPEFCAALRRHLVGGVIETIVQVDFDRVCAIGVRSASEADILVRHTLVIELMGKHSNVVLLDANRVIVDCLKRVGRRINRVREVLPGRPYLPPPKQEGRIPALSEDGAAVVRHLAETGVAFGSAWANDIAILLAGRYAGVSPFLAREIVRRAVVHVRAADMTGQPAQALLSAIGTEWDSLWKAIRAGAWSPVLIEIDHAVEDGDGSEGHGHHPTASRPGGAYPVRVSAGAGMRARRAANINFALDTAYQQLDEEMGLAPRLRQVARLIERARRRLRRRLLHAAEAMAEAARAEEYRRDGELLAANLWRVQPGDATVTVADYYNAGDERTIDLDPTRSAQENLARLFRRYRKAKAGAAGAEERALETNRLQEELDVAAGRLLTLEADDPTAGEALDSVVAWLERARLAPSAAPRAPAAARPGDRGSRGIRSFQTPEGYEILLGENAAANDYLTTRLAAPNDWWLHVRGAAGAHAVVRTNGHPDAVPHSVLLRAATLCAQRSGQKHSSVVAVDYTLRKYVRKPRGAPPGLVRIERARTIDVSPQ